MSTLTLDEPGCIESSRAAGEVVFLTKGGKRLGVILPTAENPHGVPLPDLRARLRDAWGSRVFTAAEVEALRDAESE